MLPLDKPVTTPLSLTTAISSSDDDHSPVLVKKGYEAPIHDFEILTLEFEDLTDAILGFDEPVTLVTMYDLNKTDRKQLDKVRRLYESCQARGEQCYLLTGSGEDEIYAFAEEMGWTEDQALQAFCTIDPVTLKTIVSPVMSE